MVKHRLPALIQFLIAFNFILFGFSCVTAQSTRTPRATPTPLVVPEVISRAEDQVEDSTQKPVERQSDSAAGPQVQNARRRQPSARVDEKSEQAVARERLALNLDILTKAEQRSDNLRKQLFDMMEKENSIRSRLDQIENDLRPEAIDRQLEITGSLRPEELRAQKRRSLELERQNLNNLLTEVLKARASLETNLSRSEALVERLRARLEKEIDSALDDSEDLKP